MFQFRKVFFFFFLALFPCAKIQLFLLSVKLQRIGIMLYCLLNLESNSAMIEKQQITMALDVRE